MKKIDVSGANYTLALALASGQVPTCDEIEMALARDLVESTIGYELDRGDMEGKDYNDLFRALNDQGWVVEKIEARHFKCTPPYKDKAIVMMATSSSTYRAMWQAVRDLRASGFIWPWDSKREQALRRKKKEVKPVVKTNTATATSNQPQLTVVPDRAPQPEPKPVERPTDVDRLFNDLKEARTYAALAKDARDDARAVLAKAQEALGGSEKEYELAMDQLKSAKSAFDAAFSVEEKA